MQRAPTATGILALLAIPAQPVAALTIAALSVALTAAFKVAPFGLPLVVVLLFWLFQYSFAFLDELVLGARTAPVLSVEMLMASTREWRWFVPLVIVVSAFLASGASSFWLGTLPTVAVGIIVVGALPAVIAVQGWTGTVRHSLSIPACIRMARILGTDYAWIVFFTALIAILGVIALHTFPLMLRIAVLVYGWLALVALCGGVIHRRRAAIEAHTELFPRTVLSADEREAQRSWERVVDEIYGSWRSGAQENAWRTLMRHVEQSADPIEELRKLYRRIATWDRPQLAHRVADELVSRLLAIDREGEALALTRERLAIDASYRPRSSAELIRLARIARDSADRTTARALLDDFVRVYPGDPRRADVEQLLQSLQ